LARFPGYAAGQEDQFKSQALVSALRLVRLAPRRGKQLATAQPDNVAMVAPVRLGETGPPPFALLVINGSPILAKTRRWRRA